MPSSVRTVPGLLVVAVVAALAWPAVASAQPCHRWQIVEEYPIDLCLPLTGQHWTRRLTVLTAAGDIGGTQNCLGGPDRPFIIRDGVFIPIELPAEASGGTVTDISESGIVVGWVTGAPGSTAFHWIDGELTLVPGPYSDTPYSLFEHINEAGQIAGRAIEPELGVPSLARFDLATGTFDVYGAEVGPYFSHPMAIAPSGRMAGAFRIPGFGAPHRPFVEAKHEVFTRLELPVPGGDGEARAFDEASNTILGWADAPDGRAQASIWRDGTHSFLPMPEPSNWSRLDGWIDERQLYGAAWMVPEGTRTVVWVDEGTAVDFREMIVVDYAWWDAGLVDVAEDGRALANLAFRDDEGEYRYSTIVLEPVAPPLGDLDCDGVVGFEDLLRLIARWGPCDSCGYDLDGDGTVSHSDLWTLLGQWSI